MKKSIFKILALALVGSTLFMACKKDDNPVDNTPEKVKKLMHDWKITNITTPKKLQPNVDSVLLKACTTDDIIKFSTTGFDFQDGATKCDSTIFPYSKGNWGYQLANDSIALSATLPAKYLSWKVITLNDSVLQVKYTDSTNKANKLVKTISFKR